jgi:hypothetical protein
MRCLRYIVQSFILHPAAKVKLNEAYKQKLREYGCDPNLKPVLGDGWWEDYQDEKRDEPNSSTR